jgi:retron-type reverse transcriptase
MEGDQFHETTRGTPQGGVISPLLANIYLNYMDTIWEKQFAHLGKLIRYADDCAPRRRGA